MAKRPKKPRPTKPPFQAMRSDQKVVRGISKEHTALIGTVVVMWSQLEAAMQDTMWRLLNMPFEDGRILTERLDAQSKIRMLRALAERHLTEQRFHEISLVLDAIEHRQEDRNFIVHATWARLEPENVPVGMSLRPKAPIGEVLAETFPPGRMKEIIDDIGQAVVSLAKLAQEIEASRGTPPPPLPKD